MRVCVRERMAPNSFASLASCTQGKPASHTCATLSCHKHKAKANDTEFCISNYKIIKSARLLFAHTHILRRTAQIQHAQRDTQDIIFLCFFSTTSSSSSSVLTYVISVRHWISAISLVVSQAIVNHAFRSRIFSRVHILRQIDQIGMEASGAGTGCGWSSLYARNFIVYKMWICAVLVLRAAD